MVLCAAKRRRAAQAGGSAQAAAKRHGRAGCGEASSSASRPVGRRRAAPGSIREPTRREARSQRAKPAHAIDCWCPRAARPRACSAPRDRPRHAERRDRDRPDRRRAAFRSDAHFARTAGVAPIPVSSGCHDCHSLDCSGNRQLNRALHVITITSGRIDPETRAGLAAQGSRGREPYGGDALPQAPPHPPPPPAATTAGYTSQIAPGSPEQLQWRCSTS